MSDPLCQICGQAFADREPRYRRPNGDVHVRCFQGPRVLVVDDDSLLRDLVAHLVGCARAPPVRWRRCPYPRYDLILCDLRMPVMDGPAFHRQVRDDHPEFVERIVFLTAHAKIDEYAAFVRDVGAPLLTKPFPRADLDAILGRMIGPTRSRREAK